MGKFEGYLFARAGEKELANGKENIEHFITPHNQHTSFFIAGAGKKMDLVTITVKDNTKEKETKKDILATQLNLNEITLKFRDTKIKKLTGAESSIINIMGHELIQRFYSKHSKAPVNVVDLTIKELCFTFDLKDIVMAFGYNLHTEEVLTDEQKKQNKITMQNAKKVLKEAIRTLYEGELVYKDKQGITQKTRILTSAPHIDDNFIKAGRLNLVCAPHWLKLMLDSPQINNSICTLRIDNNHPNARKIADKMLCHNSVPNNQKAGTADRLKVKTLLNIEGLILQKIEQVRKNRQSWTHKIKDKLEDNLEYLVSIGVFTSWEYVGKNGRPLTDAEADFKTYEEWEETNIKIARSDYKEIKKKKK